MSVSERAKDDQLVVFGPDYSKIVIDKKVVQMIQRIAKVAPGLDVENIGGQYVLKATTVEGQVATGRTYRPAGPW